MNGVRLNLAIPKSYAREFHLTVDGIRHQILRENTHSFLGIVLSGNSKSQPLNRSNLQQEFPDKEKNFLSPPSSSPSSSGLKCVAA